VRGNLQALFGKRPTEKDPAKGTSPAVDFTRWGAAGNGTHWVTAPAAYPTATLPAVRPQTWCPVEKLRWDTSTVEFHNAMTAVLTIRGAAKAVAFYERAFGAEEIYRNSYPDGRIVSELAVGEARFRVADEAPEAGNLSPEALGGTSVRLNLLVADPDGLAARAIAAGAIEVAPIADQSYGLRQGRLADPFGHHWLIGRPVAGEAGDWARTATR
jgi:PhnB protein